MPKHHSKAVAKVWILVKFHGIISPDKSKDVQYFDTTTVILSVVQGANNGRIYWVEISHKSSDVEFGVDEGGGDAR